MAVACWAEVLGDCAGGSSREHYVSDGIFDGEVITAFGLPWCKHVPMRVGLRAAASKILCKRHNEQLSEYDSEASKLSRFLYTNLLDDPLTAAETTLRGDLLEKWALKTFVNLGFIGALDPIDHKRTVPNAQLVRNIFRDRVPAGGMGLYFVTGEVSNHEFTVGFSWNAIRNVTLGGIPAAMTFTLNNVRFVVSGEPVMAGPKLAKLGTIHGVDYSAAQIVYRPAKVTLASKTAGRKEISLQW
jgi:hypothetical protein